MKNSHKILLVILGSLTLFFSTYYYVDNTFSHARYLGKTAEFEYNVIVDDYFKQDLYAFLNDVSLLTKNLKPADRENLVSLWRGKHAASPEDRRALAGYAMALVWANRTAEAVPLLASYSSSHPGDPFISPAHIAVVQQAQGIKEARKVYDRSEMEGSIYSHLIKGYFAADAGDSGTALKEAAAVIARDPFLLLFLSGYILAALILIDLVVLARSGALSGLKHFLGRPLEPKQYFIVMLSLLIGLFALFNVYVMLSGSMGTGIPDSMEKGENILLVTPKWVFQDMVFCWQHGRLLLEGTNPYAYAHDKRSNYGAPYGFFNYFPAALMICSMIALFPKHLAITLAFLAPIALIWLIVAGVWKYTGRDALVTGLVFSLFFLSYPFMLAVYLGNLELILFIFISLFFYYLVKKKELPAAAYLSIAISMKLYPAILLLLLWKQFGPKAALKCGLFACALMASILFFLPGDPVVTFKGMISAIRMYSDTTSGGGDYRFHLSLLVLLYRVFPAIAAFAAQYAVAAIALFSLVYVFFVRNKSFINQTVYLSASMIFLPLYSVYYTTINLYPVVLLLIMTAFAVMKSRSKLSPPFLLVSALFVILFSPKEYLSDIYPFSSLMNALLLAAIIFISARYELDGKDRSSKQLSKILTSR